MSAVRVISLKLVSLNLILNFAYLGLRVYATARRLDSMSDLVRVGIHTFTLDVCDEKSIEKALEWVSGHTGGSLDILVNNASVFFMCHFQKRILMTSLLEGKVLHSHLTVHTRNPLSFPFQHVLFRQQTTRPNKSGKFSTLMYSEL
jgi:hypothetical protein